MSSFAEYCIAVLKALSRQRELIFFLFLGVNLLLYVLWTGQLPSRSPTTGPFYAGLGPEELSDPDSPIWNQRREAVRNTFLRGWNVYRKEAWGSDEHLPLSHTGKNLTDAGTIGYGIVDAMDAMLLMDLHSEYAEARKWVLEDLSFDIPGAHSVFETTIRVLGGLLACYHLTDEADPGLLAKAKDLGDRLLPAFATRRGIPYASVDLHAPRLPEGRYNVHLSEIATLQLEFRYLSHLTGDTKYALAVNRVMAVLQENEPADHLPPTFVDGVTGRFSGKIVSVGARGDSYYEYLLKQWIQTGGIDKRAWSMHRRALPAIEKHLMVRTPVSNLLYVSDREDGVLTHSMEHLVCFYAGHLALSSLYPDPVEADGQATAAHELTLGKDLAETCYQSYHRTPTGLGPEMMYLHSKRRGLHWGGDPDFDFERNFGQENFYQMRPETIESYFLLWRITKDPIWRERGWEAFMAIQKYGPISSDPTSGFATINNVMRSVTSHTDMCETFFYAETLKYLYLLFSPDSLIPLDKYVFTTEAHPFPIIKPIPGVVA